MKKMPSVTKKRRLWHAGWVHCKESPSPMHLLEFRYGGHYGYEEYRDENGEHPEYRVFPDGFRRPEHRIAVSPQEFERFFKRCFRLLTEQEKRMKLSERIAYEEQTAPPGCCPLCHFPR